METSKEEFVEVSTLDEYQERAMTTCMETSRNVAYMTYAMFEEMGEVSGKISKAIRKGIADIKDNKLVKDEGATDESYADFVEALKAEVGDVMWDVFGLCSVMGWRAKDICNGNLRKLADRKNRNVIVGSGDNR